MCAVFEMTMAGSHCPTLKSCESDGLSSSESDSLSSSVSSPASSSLLVNDEDMLVIGMWPKSWFGRETISSSGRTAMI